MPPKKSSTLGRDLGDLLAKAVSESAFPLSSNKISSHETGGNLLEIALLNLRPGRYQPRQEIHQTELEMLADSIRAQGILQPIVVRPLSKNQYEIIAGERRFQAAKLVPLEKIPAIIKEVSDQEALAIALIENIQRENLNPLEEALALERLAKEFSLTHIQVADAIGKSRATVSNLLRLLTLTEDVKAMLARGDIEMGHAKVLLALRGSMQAQVARQIIEKKFSVRETERVVSRLLDENKPVSKKTTLDPDIRRLQESLAEKLGASVQIMHGNHGKGKLVINYNSLEELDGILEHIK